MPGCPAGLPPVAGREAIATKEPKTTGMESKEQGADVAAAFAAWEAAYDEWEGSETAVTQAISAGLPDAAVKQLIRESGRLRQVARQLFDVYVDASGGKVDSRPGPLGDDRQ